LLVLVIDEITLQFKSVDPDPHQVCIIWIELDVCPEDLLSDPADLVHCNIVVMFIFTEPSMYFVFLNIIS
jgi:hypothetical protein